MRGTTFDVLKRIGHRVFAKRYNGGPVYVVDLYGTFPRLVAIPDPTPKWITDENVTFGDAIEDIREYITDEFITLPDSYVHASRSDPFGRLSIKNTRTKAMNTVEFRLDHVCAIYDGWDVCYETGYPINDITRINTQTNSFDLFFTVTDTSGDRSYIFPLCLD